MAYAYAYALLAATSATLPMNEGRPKKVREVTPEQMAIMQREMSNVESQFKWLEQSYGQDIVVVNIVRRVDAKFVEFNAQLANVDC